MSNLVIPFQGDGYITATAKQVVDMYNTELPVTISTTAFDFDANGLKIAGVAIPSTLTGVTATAAEINKLAGTAAGLTAAELSILDGVTATTANINLLAGATVTAAELHYNDTSIETETIIAAGAVSVTLSKSKIELVGAGAITLAAPSAAMYGRVKLIEMTVDNGDVTLALTNVQGQSSGTTATFNSVGDTLVLVAGTTLWNVIGEAGIALA